MKKEITFNEFDLKHGKCRSCGEKTKIVIDDRRCPDCIFDNEFYEQSMKDFPHEEESFF